MDSDKLNALLEDTIDSFPAFFLLESVWVNDHKLKVLIDGDKGVCIQDCVEISRAFQRKLEEEDFDISLEISSPDATKPLVHQRQYKKHWGRKMEVKTEDKIFCGNLVSNDDQGIELQWEERVPKEIGKGKRTIQLKEKIKYENIQEAKVSLKF